MKIQAASRLIESAAKPEDAQFEVGYDGKGHGILLRKGENKRGSGPGARMGADGRGYTGIVRTEPFDSTKPAHHEFIPIRDYALRGR
jgi:hypothetical protein